LLSKTPYALINGCTVCAGQPWVLRKAVNHIETFSMLESLQRMVGAADQSNANVPASDLKWLPNTTILQHLTSKYVLLAI
jgi:hypothetical protein